MKALEYVVWQIEETYKINTGEEFQQESYSEDGNERYTIWYDTSLKEQWAHSSQTRGIIFIC